MRVSLDCLQGQNSQYHKKTEPTSDFEESTASVRVESNEEEEEGSEGKEGDEEVLGSITSGCEVDVGVEVEDEDGVELGVDDLVDGGGVEDSGGESSVQLVHSMIGHDLRSQE